MTVGVTCCRGDIEYATDLGDIGADHLHGFFGGWPDPPTPAEHLSILRAATHVAVGRHPDGAVVGFATAISDGRFAAYIPLLEVLPEYRGQGVASQLMTMLLQHLRDCYMVDLACDDDVVGFYDRLGGTRSSAISWRRYDRVHPAPTAGD
ncbi:GNAT family N-acetyltransferase [soil metagenome]